MTTGIPHHTSKLGIRVAGHSIILQVVYALRRFGLRLPPDYYYHPTAYVHACIAGCISSNTCALMMQASFRHRVWNGLK